MTLLELILVVLALVMGVRLGMWIANKQADARAEVQSLNARIDIEGDAITRRIDEGNRELWTRISELDSRLSELSKLKENK